MKSKIKEVVASSLRVDINEINDLSSPETIESWDSMNHIVLIIALEKEFQIKFDETDIRNLLRFDKIHKTIENKIL